MKIPLQEIIMFTTIPELRPNFIITLQAYSKSGLIIRDVSKKL
jgi:hypothetical protein